MATAASVVKPLLPERSRQEEKLMKIMMNARTKNKYESLKLTRTITSIESQRHQARVFLNNEIFVNKKFSYKLDQCKEMFKKDKLNTIKSTSSSSTDSNTSAANPSQSISSSINSLPSKSSSSESSTHPHYFNNLVGLNTHGGLRQTSFKLPAIYEMNGGGFLKKGEKFEPSTGRFVHSQPKESKAEKKLNVRRRTKKQSELSIVLPMLEKLLAKGGMYTLPEHQDTAPGVSNAGNFMSIRRRKQSAQTLVRKHNHQAFVAVAKRHMLDFGSCSRGHSQFSHEMREASDPAGQGERYLPAVPLKYQKELNARIELKLATRKEQTWLPAAESKQPITKQTSKSQPIVERISKSQPMSTKNSSQEQRQIFEAGETCSGNSSRQIITQDSGREPIRSAYTATKVIHNDSDAPALTRCYSVS